MDAKMIGWIQIVGGALALLFPGGGVGMMGMMGFGGVNIMGGNIACTAVYRHWNI